MQRREGCNRSADWNTPGLARPAGIDRPAPAKPQFLHFAQTRDAASSRPGYETRPAMPIQLNHTIVHARDHLASARFLTGLFGLPPPVELGPFAIVPFGETSLDYIATQDDFTPQHYAFLVTEAEFDDIFGRIQAEGLPHWSDPGRRDAGRINTWDGGRGVYFDDPDGHLLEIITRPYGTGGSTADKPHPLLGA